MLVLAQSNACELMTKMQPESGTLTNASVHQPRIDLDEHLSSCIAASATVDTPRCNCRSHHPTRRRNWTVGLEWAWQQSRADGGRSKHRQRHRAGPFAETIPVQIVLLC